MPTLNPIYKEIGKKIREYRDSKAMTQERLAHELGLTRTSMVHIENGNQSLTIDRIYKIAELLNVSVEKLLPSIQNIKDPFDAISRERVNKRTKREVLTLIQKTKKEK